MAEQMTVAKAYVQIMPSMEGATSNITNALTGELGAAGGSAGQAFGSKFKAIGGKLMLAAGAAFAGIMAAAKIYESFEKVEKGFNNVILATGATGDQAKELEKVYLDVSKSVVGSYEDIGAAVGELNTRLGLNGEELEKASEQAMKYAKVNGVDAKQAIADVTRMMNNAGISADQYSHMLDLLTVAAQQSGVDVSKLATSVTDNAASMKELGFTTEESIAMLANFEKTGANTSAILSGMKKGVASWTKEGKSASEGFAEFVQGVQDGSVSMEDAIEIFGSKAGVSMYDAAQKGQLSFEEMYDQITSGSEGALDQVYSDTLTAQEKFQILGQKVETGFYQILEPIVDAIAPHMDEIIEAVGTAVEFIVGVIQFISTIPDTVNGLIDSMYNAVNGFVQGIAGFCQSVYDTVSGAFELVASTIRGIWDGIASTISNVWNGIKTNVKAAVDTVKITVTSAFGVVRDTVKTIWEGIKTAITTPINKAKEIVKGAIDTISGIITGANLKLPEIKLPHFEIYGGELPWGIGGMGKKPEIRIDWYAAGGIINGASLIGVGEAGPEAIVPLSQPYLEPWADAVADEIGTGEVISWLASNLPAIISNYTPTLGERDFNRLARRALANGAV